MSLSVEQKQKVAKFIVDYRGYLSLGLGLISGLIFAILTQSWLALFLAGTVSGLIMFNNRTIISVAMGAITVVIIDLIFLIWAILNGPALTVLDIFGGLILGPGFGWLILLIILIIGLLIGASSGFLGASFSALIPWPQWLAPE